MSLFENSHGFGGGVEDVGSAMPSSWASKVRAGMSEAGGSELLISHMEKVVGPGHVVHATSSAAVGSSGLLSGSSPPLPLGGLDNGSTNSLLLPVAGMGLGSIGHYSPLALGLPVGGIGTSVSRRVGSATVDVGMAPSPSPSPSPLLLAAAAPSVDNLPPLSPANGAVGTPYAAHSAGGLLNGGAMAVAPSPQGSSASRGAQRHREAKEVLLGAFPCIVMRGLAPDTSTQDVLDFFMGLGPVLDVVFDVAAEGGGGNGGGTSGGSAVVLFGNLMDYHGALQRYSLQIKGRYVNVMSASRREYYDAVVRGAYSATGAGLEVFATPPLSSSSHVDSIVGGGHSDSLGGVAAGGDVEGQHRGGLHSLLGAPATPTTPARQGDKTHPFLPLPPPALPPPQQGQQPPSPAQHMLSQQQQRQQREQSLQKPGAVDLSRASPVGEDSGVAAASLESLSLHATGSQVLGALQHAAISTPPLHPIHHTTLSLPPPESLSPPTAPSAGLTGSAAGSVAAYLMHSAAGGTAAAEAATVAAEATAAAPDAANGAAPGGGSAGGTPEASPVSLGAAAGTTAAMPAKETAASAGSAGREAAVAVAPAAAAGAVAAVPAPTSGAAAAGPGAVREKNIMRDGGSATMATAAPTNGAKPTPATPTTAAATVVVAAAASPAGQPQQQPQPQPPPATPPLKQLQQKPTDLKGSVIRMRGLPFRASKAEVADFFKGCRLATEGVAFVTRADGRVTGEAYVKFMTREDARQAMRRDREMMGNRYIELFSSSPEEMSRYCKASGSTPI